jgi:hypothetical protein
MDGALRGIAADVELVRERPERGQLGPWRICAVSYPPERG